MIFILLFNQLVIHDYPVHTHYVHVKITPKEKEGYISIWQLNRAILLENDHYLYLIEEKSNLL